MSVHTIAVQQGELTDLRQKLSGQLSGEARVVAVGRLVALEAEGVDVSDALGVAQNIGAFGEKTYIKGRRMVGILNQKYAGGSDTTPLIVQGILNDFERSDPIVKAMAVRHAAQIADDKTIDRLVQVILRGSSSDDPYVKKASALAILTLHHVKPSFIDKFDLGQVLRNLVEDANLNVAANAVAAAAEISGERARSLFTLSPTTVNNLLATVEQASEWSQAQILDFVAGYVPRDPGDARGIIARVVSRLNHANAGIVLAAVRCCLRMNEHVQDQARVRETIGKVVLPLVTLLNSSRSIQYVALRSIHVLLQRFRRMLSSEVSIFFCKFDDPLYIKLTKLDVVLNLTNAQNVGRVVEELADYAAQADVQFVRRAIQALGRVAVNFEAAADACVDKLVAIIDRRVPFALHECIVVAVSVFRRYPGHYEGIIANVNAALEGPIDDHRARASLVWILGEYADAIENSGALLESMFSDEFGAETDDVQHAILTAVVKYYLVSEEGEDMLRRVMGQAMRSVDDPDVRERALEYVALVGEAPEQAQVIMIPETRTLSVAAVEDGCAARLVSEAGNLAVVYGRLPEKFPCGATFVSISAVPEAAVEKVPLPVLVEQGSSGGTEVRGALIRVGDQNSLTLRLRNYCEVPLRLQQIAFNKNIFGFAPGEFEVPEEIGQQQSLTVEIPIVFSEAHIQGAEPSAAIQCAILLSSGATIFFECPIRLDLLLVPGDAGGKVTKEQFVVIWGGIGDAHERSTTIKGPRVDSVDLAKTRLSEQRLFFAARRGQTGFFSGKTIKGEQAIVFLDYGTAGSVTAGVKMMSGQIAEIILRLVEQAIA